MQQNHRRQASLNQEEALMNASYIKINKNGLNIIKGSQGRYHAINGKQMSGHQISIRLPGTNELILLDVNNVQNLISDEDVVTYTGSINGNEMDYFTLSVSRDGVMGKINRGQNIYVITPLDSPGNKHSIAQLDKTRIAKDPFEQPIQTNDSGKRSNNANRSDNGSGHVKVLFYFASDVYFQSLRVSMIVSEMNIILTQSNVMANNYISSAGIVLVNSSFPGLCKNDIIVQMADATGVFSNIDQELSLYGADTAILLVKGNTGQNCGFSNLGLSGRIGGGSYAYDPSDPFSIVADTYALADLTAIHEMGHVFGGGHAVVTLLEYPGETEYSRGLFFYNKRTDVTIQSIMGGYKAPTCGFTGPVAQCERIPYFSDPNFMYEGIHIGVPDRFMSGWLNIAMPLISSWRLDPMPVPQEPNPISVIPGFCYGFNSVTWATVSDATEYKLYKSTSSNFSSPVLLFTGSSSGSFVNVNSGTWYLRAQACNASGCSGYSSQVTANRINSCL